MIPYQYEEFEDIEVVEKNLFLIWNFEDECWEIKEKDGVGPNEDAVVAKFYCAKYLAELLLSTIKAKIN